MCWRGIGSALLLGSLAAATSAAASPRTADFVAAQPESLARTDARALPPIVPMTAPQDFPDPQLAFVSREKYKAGGKRWVRYRYQVLNKAAYSDALFAPAPHLPPCGINTNSSRAWVDFFQSTGKRLYGFCAFTSSAKLDSIWFAVEEGKAPPDQVYIEIKDRESGRKYRSNLAGTGP